MNVAPSRLTNSVPGPAVAILYAKTPPTPSPSATTVAMTALRTFFALGIDIVGFSLARQRTPHCTEPEGLSRAARPTSFGRVIEVPAGRLESVRVSASRWRPVQPPAHARPPPPGPRRAV